MKIKKQTGVIDLTVIKLSKDSEVYVKGNVFWFLAHSQDIYAGYLTRRFVMFVLLWVLVQQMRFHSSNSSNVHVFQPKSKAESLALYRHLISLFSVCTSHYFP